MLLLFFALHRAIHTRGIVGLIPQVPTQNAIIIAELTQHSRDIVVQNAAITAVTEVLSTRALHPPGVGHSRSWRTLRTRPRERIPAGVEQDKEWFDAVVCRDGDELRQTALKALAILGPQLIVKEDPHSVDPEEPSHAQLPIDAPGIISARLKHLELIYRVCSDVVRADQPTLRLIPAVGAVNRPSASAAPAVISSGSLRTVRRCTR